jgi:hypothetical protein
MLHLESEGRTHVRLGVRGVLPLGLIGVLALTLAGCAPTDPGPSATAVSASPATPPSDEVPAVAATNVSERRYTSPDASPVEPGPARDRDAVVRPGITSARPAEPEPTAAELAILKERVSAAIESVRSRDVPITAPFWAIFHGILGLGPGLALVDHKSGNSVNALDYMFGGDFHLGPIRGMRFVPTEAGLDVGIGPEHEGQGHVDQFVAERLQWGVPHDRKVRVLGRDYTMLDFARESQARATTELELSWSIIVIGDCFGTKSIWTNRLGQKLKYEDVVRAELAAPVNGAACGGTHRLFGLSYALFLHLKAGGKEEGIWKEVRAHLDRHVDLAREYQQPDGTFSSLYFEEKGISPDKRVRLGSAGHTLEWLAFYLPKKRLTEGWMRKAANAVSMLFLEMKAEPVESGALYHACHGLVYYRHRVFGDEPAGTPGANPPSETHPQSEGVPKR